MIQCRLDSVDQGRGWRRERDWRWFSRGPNALHDAWRGLVAVIGARWGRQLHQRKDIRVHVVEGGLVGRRLVAQSSRQEGDSTV